ncbi:unnamed protein product [Caenorhabditis auriculariae]|uniref:LysM domain-containing protein n=1 Tax=Caenorhabditis auriculariae TaxID=2777116 RepID=A0A8S1HYI4_9PELO|nr:unnamed protein product [Caenorhabditis auriculariae]
MLQNEGVQPDERTFLCSFTKVRMYGTTSPHGSPVSSQSYILYDVKSTDTLQGVALKHNCTVSSIARANKLWSPDALFLKETIRIPVYDDRTLNATNTRHLTKFVKNDSRVKNDDTIGDILKRIDRDIETSSRSIERIGEKIT